MPHTDRQSLQFTAEEGAKMLDKIDALTSQRDTLLASCNLAVKMLAIEAQCHEESGTSIRRSYVPHIRGAIDTIRAAIAKAGPP